MVCRAAINPDREDSLSALACLRLDGLPSVRPVAPLIIHTGRLHAPRMEQQASRSLRRKSSASGRMRRMAPAMPSSGTLKLAPRAVRRKLDYKESNRHFDSAITKIDDYEQQAKVKVGHEAAAILSNQENLPYQGKSYDKIMVQTYKALNYLAMGDIEKARSRNHLRAYQRQQRDAVEDNARRIETSPTGGSRFQETESPGRKGPGRS